jgi:hypothetical protein
MLVIGGGSSLLERGFPLGQYLSGPYFVPGPHSGRRRSEATSLSLFFPPGVSAASRCEPLPRNKSTRGASEVCQGHVTISRGRTLRLASSFLTVAKHQTFSHREVHTCPLSDASSSPTARLSSRESFACVVPRYSLPVLTRKPVLRRAGSSSIDPLSRSSPNTAPPLLGDDY